MFKVTTRLKSLDPTRTITYKFSNHFRKQFNLGPTKSTLVKRLYRTFIKNINKKYLIPFKILAAGVFFAGILLLLPGVSILGQQKIKQLSITLLDEILYFHTTQTPTTLKTNKYLMSLFSTLEYWDSNGLSTLQKTNEILSKVLNTVQNHPMSDEVYTNLVMMLELRLRRLVEYNKQALTSPQTYNNILDIIRSYVQFRSTHQQTPIEKNLFYSRKQFVEFVWDYLLKYSPEGDNKRGVLALLNEFLGREELLRQSMVTFHPILQQLVKNLNGPNRKQVINIFETISKDPSVREQMVKINLVNNLKLHLPESQIAGVLTHF